MPEDGKPPEVVRFDSFELCVETGELFKNGVRVRLAGQPIHVLIRLVATPGKSVTREELQQLLWPGNTYGDFERGLNAAVNRLRDYLNDSATEPNYIETVPGRGYRFIGKLANPTTGTASGRTVSHYRILEAIGRGAMGIVYKAQDLRLGRHVALKFLPDELATNHQALARFRREASTASSLNHPNICTIYEVEEHQGQPFIVMELLEGETLREWLASAISRGHPRHPVLEIELFVDIAIQIADGLQAAHAKGVIHRDIKPTNIFITSGRLVKILDFGLAKLVAAVPQSEIETLDPNGVQGVEDLSTQLSEAGAIIGSAGYMAPEQARGEELDRRADLFSLGVVLYEMATGHSAFGGSNLGELRRAILTQTPIPISQLNSSFPQSLEQLINKALDKNRDLRHQSASDLRADLVRARQAIESLRPSAPEVLTHKQETRVLEGAAPRESVVGCSIEVIAMVREGSSSAGLRALLKTEIAPGLTEEDVRDRPFEIEFPLDENAKPQPLDIALRLDSPGFDPPSQIKKLKVPPTGDSPACTFLLIPRVVGSHVINLELLSSHEQVLASRSIRTKAFPSGAETSAEKIIVSIPLQLVARAISDRVLEMFLAGVTDNRNSDEPRAFQESATTSSMETDNPDARRGPAPLGGKTGGPDLVDKIEEGGTRITLRVESREEIVEREQQTAGRISKEFFGHYRLLEIIGRGRMGVVFKAQRDNLERLLAIQIFRGATSRQAHELLRALRREMTIIAALKHPNIVKAYEIGDEGHDTFMATELLKGSTLKQLMTAGPIKTRMIVSLAIQIADALSAAHTVGIVHGDIKPANILVTASRQAMILDFGLNTICAMPEASDEDSGIVGVKEAEADGSFRDLAYLSPEQINVTQLDDPRSDLFSFGCVLYEMAAGRPAFGGDEGTIDAILHRQPITLTQLNPQVPPKLEKIVRKALEKDRGVRYQSAADMRFDLQQLQQELGTGWLAKFGRFIPWRRPR